MAALVVLKQYQQVRDELAEGQKDITKTVVEHLLTHFYHKFNKVRINRLQILWVN